MVPTEVTPPPRQARGHQAWPLLTAIIVAGLVAVVTVVVIVKPAAFPSSSTVTVAGAESPTIEGAKALAQAMVDRYQAGDSGGAWDLWDTASKQAVTRADYVAVHEACPLRAPTYTVNDARLESSTQAVVTIGYLGTSQAYKLNYEQGAWRWAMSATDAATYKSGAAAAIAQLKQLGVCGSTSSTAPTSSPQPPAAADPGSASTTTALGQTFTWPSGLAVAVSKPVPYTPSQTAAGNTQSRSVSVTVKVSNGTDSPYAFNPFMIGPRATFNGSDASEIIDSAKNVGATNASTILPGKSATYTVAFSIPDTTGEMQLEFTSQLGVDPAIFTGQV